MLSTATIGQKRTMRGNLNEQKMPTDNNFFLKFFAGPTWATEGFFEPEAEQIWQMLPGVLQKIAQCEIEAGNMPKIIQLDLRTNVPLLSFQSPPMTSVADFPNILVHLSHSYGNYCYDDTACTYESQSPKAFLTFEDPSHVAGD